MAVGVTELVNGDMSLWVDGWFLPVWVCGSVVYSGLINGDAKPVSSFRVYHFRIKSTCLLQLSPLLSWMMHNFGPAYAKINQGPIDFCLLQNILHTQYLHLWNIEAQFFCWQLVQRYIIYVAHNILMLVSVGPASISIFFLLIVLLGIIPWWYEVSICNKTGTLIFTLI